METLGLFASLHEAPLIEEMRGRLATPRDVKRFALAGAAHMTIRSPQTNMRFTYRIREPHHATELERVAHRQKPIWFVAVLTGPDNAHHYEYIGQIRDNLAFDHGRKSRIGQDAVSVQAWRWFWNAVVRPEDARLFAQVEAWHEGRCGRCGRRLTVPSSVETGFGPECAEVLGL